MEMPLEKVTVEPLDEAILASWLPVYTRRLEETLGHEAVLFAGEVRALLGGRGAGDEVFARLAHDGGLYCALALERYIRAPSAPRTIHSRLVAELLAQGLLRRQRLERLLIPVPEDL